MSVPDRDQYDTFANQYEAITHLHLLSLERELVNTALGSCSGARVFDLGGGSGIQARQAIDAGAAVVDVVDISQEMMNIGISAEKSEGREDKVNYYLGDATKPLDHLGLEKASYDIVIANWIFDHSTCTADLEAMWTNVTSYIKPGGRLLGARVSHLGKVAASDTYGVKLVDVTEIPDGYAYKVISLTDPPLSFDATSMNATLKGSTVMDEKYGFEKIKVDYGRDAKLVKSDPDLWKDWFTEPPMAVVSSVKKL